MTDDDTPRRSGFSIRVAIVDYGDRNDDGEPTYYQARQDVTEYEMARTNRVQFIESVLRMSADKVLGAFRDPGDDD